jgi:2'-5' RNA ligase
LRTFIAVELPDDVRARLLALQELLARAGGDVKWVEEENLHVTLLFLGEVDERDLPAVCTAVGKACAAVPAFPLSVEGVGSFGKPQRPRTLWAGVGEGHEELVALHAAIEGPLLALGCYRREERKFTPHVTLGRVRGDAGVERLSAERQKQEKFVAGDFECDEVVVMSSELRSEGPVYAVLSRGRLGTARRGEPRTK